MTTDIQRVYIRRGRMVVSAIDSYRASIACSANSEALLSDAHALMRRGSYGRVIALAVLAEEEIGKSQLWAMKALGIEIPGKVLRSHEAKQMTKVLMIDLIDLLLGDLLDGLVRAKREEDPQKREALVRRAVGRQARRWEKANRDEFLSKLKDEMSRLSAMSSMKEAGFYVDMGPDGTIRSPADFTKREAEEYLRKVERRLKRLNRVWGDAPETTEKGLEAYRRWWDKVPDSLKTELSQFLQILSEVKRDLLVGLGSMPSP